MGMTNSTDTRSKFDRYVSRVHDGYMAGLSGQDPDEEMASVSNEYSEAYLIGTQDREAGVKAETFKTLDKNGVELKKGDVVQIRKGTIVKTVGKDSKAAGRTYKVTVDHLLWSSAYFEHNWDQRTLRRPVPVSVVWAGTGSYWSSATVIEVSKVD
jgi:hypothetical protein